MKNKQSINNYQKFINYLKQYLNKIKDNLQKFTQKYPSTFQTLQLISIYSFAFVDLIYVFVNNLYSLGIQPEILENNFLINIILESSILKIWATPEKMFLISYVVLDLMLIQSALNFSKLIKYNILLVFSLLMLQGLAITFWDLLFHREIGNFVSAWTNSDEIDLIIGKDHTLAGFFFFVIFLFFFSLYSYFFLSALKKKRGSFPGFVWITDSVLFWLNLQTPTMNFNGKERKK